MNCAFSNTHSFNTFKTEKSKLLCHIYTPFSSFSLNTIPTGFLFIQRSHTTLASTRRWRQPSRGLQPRCWWSTQRRVTCTSTLTPRSSSWSVRLSAWRDSAWTFHPSPRRWEPSRASTRTTTTLFWWVYWSYFRTLSFLLFYFIILEF